MEDFNYDKNDLYKQLMDTINQIDRYNFLFKNSITQVQQLLISLIIDENKNQQFQNNQKLQQNLMNEFFPNIINSLLNKKENQSSQLYQFIIDIQKTFGLFLKFFIKNINICSMKFFECILKIFDYSKPVYNLKLIDNETYDEFGDEINPNLDFINNLKQNDYIDFLCTQNQKKFWTKAKINYVNIDTFYIDVLNTSDNNLEILKISPSIKEFSVNDDYEWRLNLQIEDFIDFQDSNEVWSQKKIKDIRLIDRQDGNQIKQILVSKQQEKKNMGWQDMFDEWINVISPRVQKQNKMKKYYNLDNDYSQDFLIYQNKEKYLIQRKECQSLLFILMMNKFAKQDGFKDIYILINIENQSLDFMAQILPVIANISHLFFDNFSQLYCQNLQEIVCKQILSASENNLRNISKEQLEIIQQALMKIQKRNIDQDRDKKLETFLIQSNLMFINSQYLDKKLYGLKQIIDLIQSLKNNNLKYITNDIFKQKIVQNQLFEKLFGAQTHTSIIEKSSDILKYYLNQDLIDNDKLQFLIQNSNTQVIQQKLAIYKIIQEVSFDLKSDNYNYIIQQLLMIKTIQKEDIEIIYNLSIFYSRDELIVQKILFYFIDQYCKIEIDKSSKKLLLNRIQELLKNNNYKKFKEQILELCVYNLENNNHVIKILKIFKTIVDTYQTGAIYDWSSEKQTKYDILNHFQINKNLIQILIDNIVQFKQTIQSQFENQYQIEIEEDLFNQLSIQYCNYTYKKSIEKRIKFITFCVNTSKQIAQDNFSQLTEQLWNTLVLNKNFKLEKNIFFNWFTNLILKQNNADNIEQFFTNHIIPRQELIQDITQEQLLCYQTIFLLVNENLSHLQILNKDQMNNRFNLISQPQQLIGLNIFWDIIYLSRCPNIQQKAIEFLVSLYIVHNTLTVKNHFLQKCLESLQQGQNKTITILTQFLNESEIYGVSDVKSHAQNIPRQQIVLNINNDLNKDNQKIFNLRINLNKTLFELRNDLALSMKCSWDVIQLQRENNVVLQDNQNGLTLFELNLKQNEKITAIKKNITQIARVNLTDQDGNLVEKAKQIFIKWFKDYSQDGLMSPQNAVDFLLSCTNESCHVQDSRIQFLFQKYDLDQDGFLTQDNFLDFYTNSCIQRSSVVWMNLNTKGISNDLRDENENLIVQIDKQLLPRYIIFQNEQFYQILLCNMNEQNYLQTQKLLNRLPTSQNIQNLVENMELGIDINNLNPYILYYQLQILEQLFNNIHKKQSVQKFIQQNGLIYLLKIFEYFFQKDQSIIIKQILCISLKIIFCILYSGYRFKNNQNLYTSSHCEIFVKYDLKITSTSLDSFENTQRQRRKSSFDIQENQQQQSQKNQSENQYLLNELQQINLQHFENEILDYDRQKFLDQVLKLLINILQNNYIYNESIELVFICINTINLLVLNNNDLKLQDFQLVIQNIFHKKQQNIRKLIKCSLYLLSRDIKQSELAFQILQSLLQILPSQENQNIDCAQYYELLSQLLEEIQFLYSKGSQIKINTNELFQQMIQNMDQHISTEDDMNIQDKILIGYVNLANHMVELNPNLANQNFTVKFFQTFIFNFENQSVKLKNQNSRKQGYKLFLNLLKFSQYNLYQFINSQNGAQQLINQLYQIFQKNHIQNNYHAQQYIGLYNMRNICYINSVIQQLYMNKALRNLIFMLPKTQEKIELVENNYYSGLLNDNFLSQIQKCFGFLNLSKRQYYNAYELCYSFKDYDGEPIDVGVQEDANEFQNRLFDLLENETSKTQFKQVMQGIYQGSMNIIKTCKSCGYERNQEDLFYNLILEVKNFTNIHQSLEKYVQGDELEGVSCDQCKQKTNLQRRQYFKQLPNNLFVQLQRFEYDLSNAMSLNKINQSLKFPMELDLKNYLHDKNQNDSIYNLKGVILHSGFAQAGHYRSIIKDDNGDWYMFDDKSVSKYDTFFFEKDCFGDSSQKDDWQNWNNQNYTNAYILQYEKVVKSPISLIFNSEDQIQNLKFIEKIQKDDQIICKIDYQDFQQEIPQELQQLIQKDNFRFMLENHIFCTDFLIFVKELNQLLVLDSDKDITNIQTIHQQSYNLSQQQIETYENQCHFIVKLFQVMLFNTSDYLMMYEIMNQLKYFMSLIPQRIESLAYYFILNKNDESYILESLKSDIESTKADFEMVKIINFSFILYTFNIIICFENQQYDSPEKNEILFDIDSFLIKILKVLHYNPGKNYFKMTQYFEFWKQLASSEYQLTFMIQQQIITKFIDYFLDKDVPNSQDNQLQPLQNLIETICIMAQKIDSPNLKQSNETIKYLRCSDEDIQSLRNIQLYEKCLQNQIKLGMISQLMVQVCYNDYEISKQFADLILSNINQHEYISSYLNFMFDFLSIRDDLSQQRQEWILGFPQLIIKNNQINMQELSEQTYQFVSTINNAIPILSLLQSQKGSYGKKCQIINKLLQVCLINQDLLQNILNLPCHNYIEINMIQYFANMVQKYSEYGMNNNAQAASLKKDTFNILSKINLQQTKQQYIYGKIDNIQLYQQIQLSEICQIYIYKCKIKVIKSQPNGVINLTFNQELPSKFQQKFKENFFTLNQICIYQYIDDFEKDIQDNSDLDQIMENQIQLVYIENNSQQTLQLKINYQCENGIVPQTQEVSIQACQKDLVLSVLNEDQNIQQGNIQIQATINEVQSIQLAIENNDVGTYPQNSNYYCFKKNCNYCYEENDQSNSFCIKCFRDF